MISEAITGVFNGVVKPVLDKWIPDAKDRLEAEQLIAKGMLSIDMAQLAVNVEEAKSENLFVAGWRPAIGWTCVAAYGYTFVIQPFLAFLLAAFQIQHAALPHLDLGELSIVLFGILGLGSMRSFDKMGAKNTKT